MAVVRGDLLGIATEGMWTNQSASTSAAMTVDNITPDTVTFGEQIEVTGENLGDSAGAFILVDEDGGWHFITADYWSTSAISATIPVINALAGLCNLTLINVSGDQVVTVVGALTVYSNVSVTPTALSAVMSIPAPAIYDTSEDITVSISAALSAATSLLAPTVSATREMCDWTTFSQLPDAVGTFDFNSPMYNKERELYASLLSEGYMKHGVSMTYYTISYNTSADKVWGEDNTRVITRQFQFKGYCEMPSEERMLSRFGIEDLDSFTIFASRKHFAIASTTGHSNVVGNRGIGTYSAYTPKVGDVIRINSTNILYEISFVDESGPSDGIFLQGKFVWEMIVRPYRDRHHTLSPTTSASLSPMDTQSNKSADIRDATATIATRKPNILYTPKTNEKDPGDPFASW